MKPLKLRGVVPAHLSPFREDFSLDADELRRHIRTLADVDGVDAIISNGHAGEVTALSDAEYVQVIEIAKDTVGADYPIISGVVEQTAEKAAWRANVAKAAGADAILLFPPNLFNLGASNTSELPYRFVSTVAEKADIPIVLFQFSVQSRIAYTTDTLVRMVENIPSIVAIKEGTDEMQRYEDNVRALRACKNQVSILCTNNTKLLPSLAIGGDGIISGSGSVISPLLSELFRHVENNDLFSARAVYERMYPLMRVFYADPVIDMHNRMKVALKLLGLQKRAISRDPMILISPEEEERIRQALVEANLL
ncbi:MAG: dihydrodipicolinate synthase family protein [Clostridia bacterium]|nr:dihydrodipicolinate synthase family protein [Clostridia bacterium]